MNIDVLVLLKDYLDQDKIQFHDNLEEVSLDLSEAELATLLKKYNDNIDLSDEAAIQSNLQEIMEGVVQIATDFAKKDKQNEQV